MKSDSKVETLIRRETPYAGKTLTLHKDIVRLPNGKDAFREIVDHRGSVVIVAATGTDVYFVRQYRHATGETLLELAAGTIDTGEDPATCAVRETAEELGLAAGKLTQLCQGFVSPGYTSELQSFFLAEDLSPATAECDDDEFLDVVTMTWEAALAALDRGEFRDSKTVLGLLMAARRLGAR